MGLPGGGRGVMAVAGCKGWKGCGHGKRQQGNQTAQDVRPMPRNQSKPQKPDRPCATKKPNCGPFRKPEMGIRYAFRVFT